MSRVIENALIAVEESKFNFLTEKSLEVLNAHIFWTNFRGEANRFGNSARYFNLALTPEVAIALKNMGFRIREIKEDQNDDASRILYFVQIKVNMAATYPPLVNLYSEFKGKRNKRSLDENSIGELDRIDILTADCVVNIYESPQFVGKLSGYLQKLNVIQEPGSSEFGGKYDDWLDEEYDCLADGTCSLEEYNAMKANK